MFGKPKEEAFEPIMADHLDDKGKQRRMVMMAGAIGAVLYGGLTAYQFWPESPTEAKVIGTHWIILLDSSEVYSPAQLDILKQRLNQDLAARVKTHDQLELYDLTEDAQNPYQQLFAAEVPPRATDGFTMREKRSAKDRRWQEEFWQPFLQALEKPLAGAEKKHTPLIEALFELSRTARHSSAQKVVLILASDCLQHSKSISTYRRNFYEKNAHFWQAYPVDFGEAAVEVLYMQRPSVAKLQTQKHRQWLGEYLRQSGAGSVVIEGV